MHPAAKDTYCSYCGTRFPDGAGWPRSCGACGEESYRNPVPVAVLVVPVADRGFLISRRGIEPQRGGWAFPGGYMEVGETWQEAAARELFEETWIRVDPAGVSLLDVGSSLNNTLVVFGLAQPIPRLPDGLPPLPDETLEVTVAERHVDLCFPLHDRMLRRLFEEGAP